MAVTAALIAFTTISCNGGNGMDALSPYEGTWKLTIVTDSFQNNGVWFKNETLPEGTRVPTRTGRLTVTRDKRTNTLNVLARIEIAGDSVDYYRTTLVYDADAARLESGEDYQSSVGPKHFTFGLWKHNQGKFKSDASYTFNSTPMVERATNYVER